MPSSSVSRARPLQVEQLEDRYVPSAFDYVTHLYTDLLNRVPSTAEVNGFVSILNQGGTALQVALDFTQSAEFRTNLIQINYQNLLGRAASSLEISAWMNLFQRGLREEQFQALVVSSSEYLLKHGNNLATWLNAIYLDVLNRPIDTIGLNFWLSQLASGASPSAVA